jgi:hypothetical protein
MYTHEDALYPNSNNQLLVKEGDSGTTYRSRLYKSDGTTDFNDTSTVLRVNFENGVTAALYADANLAERVMRKIYPAAAFRADISVVPHHGFDIHADLMKLGASKIYLYTQNKSCIYGPDDDVVTNDLYGTWRETLRTNYVTMFPEMNVRKGVEPKTTYKIYFGGSETAIIDINALKKATTVAAYGACVQTRDVLDFEYTGWTIDALSDAPVYQGVISVADLRTESNASIVQTNAPLSYFVPAPQPLIQDERYLLMSNKYGYIMSYDPVSNAPNGKANAASSLTKDQNGDSANTYYISNNNVYIDQSARENVMWVLRQYKEATNGQIADWKPLMVTGNPSFGGQAYYKGIELKKDVYGDDGVTYWTSTGAAREYRFLCYRSDSTPFKNVDQNKELTGASARPQYIVESFGDTYLIYYKASNTDYRFVYCDQYGNWGVRRYANGAAGCRSVSEIKGDLEELKLRLYKHQRNASATKRVALKGYQTFYVDSTATAASVLEAVQANITVYDPDLKNLHVASSGTSAVVGCYRLAFSGTFKPSVPGTYTVKVIYRAEANKLGVTPTDVVVGTVKVVVTDGN